MSAHFVQKQGCWTHVIDCDVKVFECFFFCVFYIDGDVYGWKVYGVLKVKFVIVCCEFVVICWNVDVCENFVGFLVMYGVFFIYVERMNGYGSSVFGICEIQWGVQHYECWSEVVGACCVTDFFLWNYVVDSVFGFQTVF